MNLCLIFSYANLFRSRYSSFSTRLAKLVPWRHFVLQHHSFLTFSLLPGNLRPSPLHVHLLPSPFILPPPPPLLRLLAFLLKFTSLSLIQNFSSLLDPFSLSHPCSSSKHTLSLSLSSSILLLFPSRNLPLQPRDPPRPVPFSRSLLQGSVYRQTFHLLLPPPSTL